MTQAKQGDTVSVHYTGKLPDGSVFDSSMNREPLQFTLGENQVIPGFEEAVEGMNTGDKVTVTIPRDQAYGDHREDLLMKVGREQFPDNISPQEGMRLEIRQQDGRAIPVVVTAVDDEGVVLDANHPLAGQDLIFDIELVEVQ